MQSDEELICLALMYWANHIETGTAILSATDAVYQKKSKLVKPLDDAQRKLVARLRELSNIYLGKTTTIWANEGEDNE